MSTKGAKRKPKEMKQLLEFFMQKLFTLKNQRKFFLYLQQREKKQLILLIFLNSTAV